MSGYAAIDVALGVNTWVAEDAMKDLLSPADRQQIRDVLGAEKYTILIGLAASAAMSAKEAAR